MTIRDYMYDGKLLSRVEHELILNGGHQQHEHAVRKNFVLALYKSFTPVKRPDHFERDFWDCDITKHYGEEFLIMLGRVLDLWIRMGCVSESQLCGAFADYMHVVVYG